MAEVKGLDLQEASSRLPTADVPFGTQTNKNKKSVSACTSGPSQPAPPIQALWLFSFTAPATLSEMN